MAKKKLVKKAVKKTEKETKADVAAVIEKFSELSPEDRIKLSQKLSAAANKDADHKSTGATEDNIDHYDEIYGEFTEEEEEPVKK